MPENDTGCEYVPTTELLIAEAKTILKSSQYSSYAPWKDKGLPLIERLAASLTAQSAELAAAQTKLGEAEKVIAEAHDITEYQDVTDGFARTWTTRILAAYTPTESTQ